MMQIFTCEQGTPEWFACRMGIPTASEFKTIVGVKKDAREKVTRQTYMRKLAGEILTGEPMESYSNAYLERGKSYEDEARALYGFLKDIEPERVGFIRNGNTGCSPDSLVGKKRGLEIKVAIPHIQIERLERNELPPEHKLQVQGNIWLAERDEWDFMSYCPKLPPLIVTVRRDEKTINEIAKAVTEFNEELEILVGRIRRYENREAA